MVDEKLVEDFSSLSKENREDFTEELIDKVIENDVKMSQQERNAMLQFAKGHYNKSLLSKVLVVINRADPNALNQLSNKYIKPEVQMGPISIKGEVGHKDILERINQFSRTIKTDLVDDLLSILSNDEMKKLNLTQRERTDILQLIKGHYTPARLFNALQVAIRTIDMDKMMFKTPVARKLDKELRFGVELVPSIGLDKLVDYGRQFEVGGIDNIWITDHYTNKDPYVTLTLVARATDSAQLGVGVTNPYIRHLASTASAIASLDSVSQNRMILGLGAGDKSTLAALNIETYGALTTVYETVNAIRLLWAEDNVNYTGKFVQLENARLNFRPERRIPIYIGAQGPKMLSLAGEIGDGVLINGSNELDFEIARKRIIEGVNKVNKSIKDVDVVAYTCFSTSDDSKTAMKATIPVVAFIAAATPQKVLERHDLNVEKASQMKDALSKGDMAKAFGLVDNSFIEAFSVSGNPQQCTNKIENLKKAGVTQFVFGSPLGPKKKSAINLITEKILSSYT